MACKPRSGAARSAPAGVPEYRAATDGAAWRRVIRPASRSRGIARVSTLRFLRVTTRAASPAARVLGSAASGGQKSWNPHDARGSRIARTIGSRFTVIASAAKRSPSSRDRPGRRRGPRRTPARSNPDRARVGVDGIFPDPGGLGAREGSPVAEPMGADEAQSVSAIRGIVEIPQATTDPNPAPHGR
jgi:hypothetical protein